MQVPKPLQFIANSLYDAISRHGIRKAAELDTKRSRAW
jgi:hypothetical protein